MATQSKQIPIQDLDGGVEPIYGGLYVGEMPDGRPLYAMPGIIPSVSWYEYQHGKRDGLDYTLAESGQNNTDEDGYDGGLCAPTEEQAHMLAEQWHLLGQQLTQQEEYDDDIMLLVIDAEHPEQAEHYDIGSMECKPVTAFNSDAGLLFVYSTPKYTRP